ncbi:MAG: amidohydrolase family protein, partial [Synergistaceae bacterium]|nr:amidohydrolase family protein [Synergistaceae bacterium]
MAKVVGRADKIFINGNIYTVDPGFSVVQAIAARDGRILWAGTDEQVRKLADAGTEVFDLRGRTVVPGLIESHLHPLFYGERLLSIDCFTKDKDVILREVKAAYDSRNPGEWITGAGWNEVCWSDKRLPAKEDLDRVAPDAPVC